MINQIKQAMRMYKAGNTHGEIKEVTGLSSEVELAATEIASKYSLTAQQVYVKLPLLKPGMKWGEVEAVYGVED